MTLLSLPLGQITFYKSILNSACNHKNFKNHISLFAKTPTQFFTESHLTKTFLWLMSTSSVYDNSVNWMGVSK